ncbi:MAG: DegT/DnrJ/EryC1/StrS family aminotransferase [Thermoleophilaceae bacterium]
MTAATETFPEIPFFDLRVEQEDLDAVAETLRSGWLTMGPRTAKFEEAFAEYVGAKHAVAVSSCTAALHLAYLGAGVGPGDEVIVPAFTFAATAAAVIYCGATPVFADILGQHDLSIDPEDVERKITDRTKAVAAVHFAGYPAPVDVLKELCDSKGIALIEDAAHGPGGYLNGRHIGTFGLAGAFSFFSNKVLSVGEGGMLATDDDELAASARTLRCYGMTSGSWDRHSKQTTTYDVTGLGYNYKLDEPRSAMLLTRLGRLDKDIARRRELIMRYRARLSKLDALTLPFRDEDVATASAYVMPIMLSEPGRQGEFRAHLRDNHGVQTSIFYPATHEFTAYRERFPGVSLPRTELAARTEVTIPLYAHMTNDEQDRVMTAIEDALR